MFPSRGGSLGTLQIGIRSSWEKIRLLGSVAQQRWMVRDVTNWYQSHGFNTEPGWAMLVEDEAKVSEKNC
jgi:hypothetical protein